MCADRRPHRSITRTWHGALLASLLSGCAGWARIPPPWPNSLAPDTRLQVWSHGRGVVLRNISVEADSLRGVPVSHDSLTQSESVSFARDQVDSLQAIRPDRPHRFGYGFLTGVLAGAGAMFGLILG